MSSEANPADDGVVTFHVKSAGNAKYTLSLPLSTPVAELKNKLATADFANVPADAQRLIYSGRVMKNEDTLATYNVKEGNTMHLVKSAASNQRQNPANQPTSSTSNAPTQPAGVPQNIAAGTGNNPLAGLTGARYAGFAQLPGRDMFGPDGGMGPPPSTDEIIEQLSNPQTAQMLNEALQNPQVLDLMIQQNPHLRSMGPQARQILQSEHFRRMMTNPEAIRSMAQMHRAMGMDPFGGMGGAGQSAFPAPGVTNTTDPQNRDAQTPADQTQNQQQNPFASLFGGAGMGNNPFAAMFNSPLMNVPPQPAATATHQPSTTNTTASPTSPNPQQQQQQQQPQQVNPFAALFNPAFMPPAQQTGSQQPNAANSPLMNPELFAQFAQAMNAGGAGSNLFGGMPGFNMPPPDNRPPEERYEVQLGQLNQMGFHDFDRNVQALRRSGGDINGALEWLFSQPS